MQAPSPPSRVTSKIGKDDGNGLFRMRWRGIVPGVPNREDVPGSLLERPIESETRLGLPLFINIPRHNLGGGSNELGAEKRQALLAKRVGMEFKA